MTQIMIHHAVAISWSLIITAAAVCALVVVVNETNKEGK